METRLIVAYLLIALMMAAAALGVVAILRKRSKVRMTRHGHGRYNGGKHS